MLFLPISLDCVVPAGPGLPSQQGNHLMHAFAIVEGGDQRLDDAGGTVVGATVTPGFQIMRFIYMPLAQLSSFILIKSMMNAERNVGIFQRIRKTKVRRCIVCRI